jgi:hypothetical protein
MLPHRYLASLSTTASAGVGGAIVGAFTHQDVLTWCGVIVAILSALVSATVAGYHQIREAARQEDLADRKVAEQATRRQIQVQVEYEARIRTNAEKVAILEKAVTELVDRVRSARCPLTLDGRTRCEASDSPEPLEARKD